MYRVIVLFSLLTYCFAFPFSSSNLQKPANNVAKDASEIVDSVGAGYSFFDKQAVDFRPSIKSTAFVPPVDISEYKYSSALEQQPVQTKIIASSQNQFLNKPFGQQQLIPRANVPVQTLLPHTIQLQQPVFVQKDLSPIRAAVPTGYNTQQQSSLLTKNTWSNPRHDLHTLDSQQILLPKTNLNVRDRTLGSSSNQQQLLAVPQRFQPTWSAQQSTSFSSSFGGQGQRPTSFGFVSQTNQQNDRKPVTNTVFMSSQVPAQRILAQSHSVQQQQPAAVNSPW